MSRHRAIIAIAGFATVLGFAGGVAVSQPAQLTPITAYFNGLSPNRVVQIVCANSNNTVDSGRRLTVYRPQGNQNSPDIAVQCL